MLAATAFAQEEPKTLTRTADHITVTGQKIGLGNIDIPKLALFACHNGECNPIPFQIDERTDDNDYAFTKGPEAKTDSSPNVFDSNDELVFSVRDTGDRFSPLALPNYVQAAEIEVTDPQNGNKGWCYLLEFSGPAQRSKEDRVNYLLDEDQIDTIYYTVGFAKKVPIAYDYLCIKSEAGGNNTDILDRFKMHVWASFFFGKLHYSRNEEDFTSRLVAWIDGPIRVIRRTKNALKVFGNVKVPEVIGDSVYYDNGMMFPTIFIIPVRLDLILTKGEFIGTTDFSPNAKGMVFYNSRNPNPMVIDGKMDASEKALDLLPYEWAVVTGPQGTWMSRLVLGAGVNLNKNLYYVDDESAIDAPEEHPGQIGSVGYRMDNLHKAHRGENRFASIIYIPPNFKRGMESQYLDIIDHPLRVEVKILK